jgi:hypothetical protein
MAKHPQRSNVSQLQRHHGDMGWIILWAMSRPPAGDRWSVANEGTEEAALARTRHLIRLGLVVHAIKDPTGSVFLDEVQIAERFAATRPSG